MKRISIVVVLSGLVATAIACTSFSSDPDPATDDGGADAAQTDRSAPAVDANERDAAPDRPIDPSTVGCSDGTVEDFIGSQNIAACEGAWGVPGLFAGAATTCQRLAGNNAKSPAGVDCSSQDLCAAGWHVCNDAADVANHQGGGAGPCRSLMTNGFTFYATAQPSNGASTCSNVPTDVNDVFGCGDTGSKPAGGCTPLNATIGTFTPVNGFTFGSDDTSRERENVRKTIGPGGVLCCRD